MRKLVLPAVALFVSASSVSAQAPCKVFPPTKDSVAVQIQLVLRTMDTAARISALDADEILRALAANISLPRQLELPIFAGSSDSAIVATGNNYAWPQFTGRVRFTLRPGGRILDIAPTVRSMTAGLEQSLLRALAIADSTRAFEGMMIPKQGHALEYQLVARERTDSLSLVLRKTKFPAYRIEHGVQPLPGNNIRPDYPYEARTYGAEGSANFVFVVGESGAIVPGTAIQISGSFKELSQAVIDILPRLRFGPAVAAGCPINIWTRQDFNFRLTPRN